MVVRRLLIALAVLIALTAVAAGVNAPREAGSGEQAGMAPAVGAAEAPLEVTLPAKRSDRRIVVDRGREVRITVEGDLVASVELGELDVAPVDPDSPAIFDVLADDPGSYPITLLEENTRIGVLEVRP